MKKFFAFLAVAVALFASTSCKPDKPATDIEIEIEIDDPEEGGHIEVL